ncbi:MAG TPA: hypothetical protein ENN02_02960, partial [Halothiobacillus sp.]|nr:hypothetical protein [Halothiobacillus sp.]
MSTELTADTQRILVNNLKNMLADHHGVPVDAVSHIETHISHVLLAGDRAYKIKKPMDFGFLDFST